jgi:hypothetical protein
MTSDPPAVPNLERENAYLRARVAQLQADLTDVDAEVHRLRQELERRYALRQAAAPNPLGSGQRE